jgi:hypothetical protein
VSDRPLAFLSERFFPVSSRDAPSTLICDATPPFQFLSLSTSAASTYINLLRRTTQACRLPTLSPRSERCSKTRSIRRQPCEYIRTLSRATQSLIISRTALNQEKSPLLRLPAELRNQVYEYVFGDREIDVVYHRSAFEYKFEAYMSSRPERPESDERVYNLTALLGAYRQLYAETKFPPFIYGHLDHLVTGGSLLHSLRALTKEQREAVRSLRLKIDNHFLEVFSCQNLLIYGEIETVPDAERGLDEITRPILRELPGLKTLILRDVEDALELLEDLDTERNGVRVVMEHH